VLVEAHADCRRHLDDLERLECSVLLTESREVGAKVLVELDSHVRKAQATVLAWSVLDLGGPRNNREASVLPHQHDCLMPKGMSCLFGWIVRRAHTGRLELANGHD